VTDIDRLLGFWHAITLSLDGSESMDKQEIVLRFEGLTSAEAGVEAQGLREMLADASPDVDVTLRRERAESMDMGATLVLLLGTPAVIAVAKGIAAFIGKRGNRAGSLVVQRVGADGSIERFHFNGDSADAAKVAEALRSPRIGAVKG
jgi:hypothetical protein